MSKYRSDEYAEGELLAGISMVWGRALANKEEQPSKAQRSIRRSRQECIK
jgi:hypothetical protein